MKNKKKIIKVLKQIDVIWQSEHVSDKQSNNDSANPGRKQIYSELSLFKIFILMKLIKINTIKGIWRFLTHNKDVRKACGLESNIDRSTLSRRLSDKIRPWFL